MLLCCTTCLRLQRVLAMARHRNVRSRLHSYDDDYSHDPDFFDDDDDYDHIRRADSGKRNLSTFMEPTHEEMEACFFAVCEAVPAFTDEMVNDAIYDAHFQKEKAIEALLGGTYGYPPGYTVEKANPATTDAPPGLGPADAGSQGAAISAAPPASGASDAAAAAAASATTGAGAGAGAGAGSDTSALGANSETGAGVGATRAAKPPAAPVVIVLGSSKPGGAGRKGRKGDGGASGENDGTAAPAVPGRVAGGVVRAASVARGLESYTVDDGRHIEAGDRKPVINLVVVGHVDAGKSTLMGHLLYKLGGVSSKQLHKMKKGAREVGKGSFAYAWVLDQHAEERERGVTMDVGTHFFETDNRRFVLLDAPGHKDFIPNMITGAAQADASVLVVPAKNDEFEVAFSESGQTREHATLLRSLGVKRLVVAINKMDMVNWSKSRFAEIKDIVLRFLKSAGFKPTDLTFVPVSGLEGQNLVTSPHELGHEFRWYTGPTLLAALDKLPKTSRRTEKPLRMCVSDVYKRMGLGVTVSGKIEAGRIVPGNRVLLMPANVHAGVKGLEINKTPVTVAVAGENVEIKAQIFILPALRIPLVAGQQLTFHMHHLEEPCNITKLLRIVNTKTGRTKTRRPRCLLRKQTASVRIKFLRRLPLELFRDNRRLGRFMLRYSGHTVAAGVVNKIMK